MRKLLVFLLSLLLLLSSCSIRSDGPENIYAQGSWARVFFTFWDKMDSSYGLWSLKEASYWDDVYDEYMPRFEALGNVSVENRKGALLLFKDILSDLDDMHFDFFIVLEKELAFRWPNATGHVLQSLGYSDDELYESCLYVPNKESMMWERQTKLDSDPRYAENEYHAERMQAITENFFAIDYDKPYTDIPINVEYPLRINHDGWRGYTYYCKEEEGQDPIIFTVALSSDGILYAGLSEFAFHTRANSFDSFLYQKDPYLSKVYNYYLECLSSDDLTGIIIDVRGNPGGFVRDLDLLFSPFVSSSTPYLHIRTKTGANRLEYSPWVAITMEPNADGILVAPSLPIAVLANSGSGSCSESAVLFFRTLSWEGRDVRIIGSKTVGASATLIDGEELGAGAFTIDEYGIDVTCGTMEARDTKGVSYEGIGQLPDVPIDFNYDDFSAGIDARLNAALSWLRTGTIQ